MELDLNDSPKILEDWENVKMLRIKFGDVLKKDQEFQGLRHPVTRFCKISNATGAAVHLKKKHCSSVVTINQHGVCVWWWLGVWCTSDEKYASDNHGTWQWA